MELRLTPAQDEVVDALIEIGLYKNQRDFINASINEKIDKDLKMLKIDSKIKKMKLEYQK